MKRAFVYIVLALTAQVLAPVAFAWIYTARYETQTLSNASEELLTVASLAIAALAGLLLGGRAAYLLLYHAPRIVAWPILFLVCAPLFVSGSIYLFALLIFRSWA